jgi:archaellum component FlaC
MKDNKHIEWYNSLDEKELKALKETYGKYEFTSDLKMLMFYKDQFYKAWSLISEKNEINIMAKVTSRHINIQLSRLKNTSSHGVSKPLEIVETIKEVLSTINSELADLGETIEVLKANIPNIQNA